MCYGEMILAYIIVQQLVPSYCAAVQSVASCCAAVQSVASYCAAVQQPVPSYCATCYDPTQHMHVYLCVSRFASYMVCIYV